MDGCCGRRPTPHELLNDELGRRARLRERVDELGLDSLDWASLLWRMEEHGYPVDEDAAAAAVTVRDLLAVAGGNPMNGRASFETFMWAVVLGMGFHVGYGIIALIIWAAAKAVGVPGPHPLLQ